MKKRIACVLLTLIMLISLVPAAALTASAASRSISESAITVLKQLEGYSTTCNANGYTGYGTKCTEKGTHGAHTTTEKKADVALREKLAELDTAVNSFATKNGLSLTQNKHDALVLFSFENGTAWTTGTGDFKAAVTSGKKGTEFLNAICWWDNSTADDTRRMIEANMYLNGVYSSSKPSQFIRIELNVNSTTAKMSEAKYQYYDVSSAQSLNIVPTNSYYTFMGWYTKGSSGSRVTSLTSAHNGYTLYAYWQAFSVDTTEAVNLVKGGTSNVSYRMDAKNLASTVIYTAPDGDVKKDAEDKTVNAANTITITFEFLDTDGTRWGYLKDGGWVKVAASKSGSASSNSSATQTDNSVDMTVTVTNAYVNRREGASIYSAKNGTYNLGAQLRIINTPVNKDGFLWGNVAESADSNETVGWVALMYTNYESVRSQDTSVSYDNSNVVATATITYNGYVNVRSDAGTANQFVGALPKGTTVNLYETKYVNGIQWGRCSTGWFCLAYADVTRLTTDTSYTSDNDFLSYVFTGTLLNPNNGMIFEEPSETAERVRTRETIDPNITITNLTYADGYTWGKFDLGWVRITDNKDGSAVDVKLDTTKYYVSANSLTVRESPSTSASRVDTLSKGVEFDVNKTSTDGKFRQVVVVGDSIWGYADKVGEDNKTYNGWVNLASKYVSRTSVPTVTTTNTATPTGQTATIVGADSVRVRMTGALYGQVLGSIPRGTTVNILGEDNGWYKIDYDVDDNAETDSWVYGEYVSVSEGTVSSGSTGTSGTASSTEGTGIGIISNTYGGVNVRSTPGINGALLGKIVPGTQVNILEVTTKGTSRWGRVEQGWICMDYVTIISDLPADVLASITGSTGTSNSGTSNSTSTAEVAIYTGTVNQEVNIRKEPSLTADIVRTLQSGANITMHEIITVTESETTNKTDSSTGSTTTTTTTTSYWARVNDGYIYNPAGHLNLDTLDEATYTVTGSDSLNVRDAAGTKDTSVKFKLAKGDQVTITKVQIVNGNVWGYVECDNGEGWASLAYMTKGAVSVVEETVPETTAPTETAPILGSTGNTGSSGYVANGTCKYTGKVVNTNSLNVRVTPSTGAAKATTLKSGTSIKIYETCISDEMAWGRCDAGWVYLYYVDLTPASGSAIDARVVYTDNTVIYTDSSCSDVAGTYTKMAVIDIYETSADGTMVRTELGWVSIYNLM